MSSVDFKHMGCFGLLFIVILIKLLDELLLLDYVIFFKIVAILK